MCCCSVNYFQDAFWWSAYACTNRCDNNRALYDFGVFDHPCDQLRRIHIGNSIFLIFVFVLTRSDKFMCFKSELLQNVAKRWCIGWRVQIFNNFRGYTFFLQQGERLPGSGTTWIMVAKSIQLYAESDFKVAILASGLTRCVNNRIE